MKRIGVVAFAVLCMCMAATASASAHLFHTSTTGKLLGLSDGSQVFLARTGGATVTCTHAVVSGTVAQLLQLHQLAEVNYLNCTAAGGLATVHVSPALYLLSADGLVAIANTIKLLVLETFITPHCTITVGPQNLLHLAYDTDPGNSKALLVLALVHSIKSTSTGEPCGPAGELTGGTYLGNLLVDLEGGSIGWL
jgi:hypothetical protein